MKFKQFIYEMLGCVVVGLVLGFLFAWGGRPL
jgi:NhaP-type Na+/H+ or K+/H+ antiporter